MHQLIAAGAYAAGSANATYVEQLRVEHLSVGTYSIPAGAPDPQGPHAEDEIYVVTEGRATLRTPTRQIDTKPGDVLFVPAGEAHRFIDVSENFCALVIFGPAEHTRAIEP